MKRLREWSPRGFWDNGNMMGLLFGLAVLAVLLPGLLSGSRLGTVDNGRYEQSMLAAGLTYLPEDAADPETLYYDHVIERYAYGSFQYWKLLAPNGRSSILYPITLIRLVTQPFGLPFSTQYLAVLYAILFAIGTYMLVKGCGYIAGWLAAIPGGLLLLAAGSRNLTAFFGSLYPVATVVVSLLLMTAAALRMFTYGRKRLGSSLALFLVCTVFCLNSSVLSVLFAPFAAAALLGALVLAGKDGRLRLPGALCAVLVFLAAVSSSAQYHRESGDITSDASAYQAAFTGFLATSDHPAADLAEFGLDESYLADIGKSFYLSRDDYAHCPRDAREAEALFQKLNRASIGKFYLRHPLRLLQTANGQGERYNHFESQVVLQVGRRTSDEGRLMRSWSLADTLMQMLLPQNYSGMTLLLLLELAASFWLTLRLWKHWGPAGSLPAGAALLCLGLGCFGYVPVYLRYMGNEFLDSARIVGVFGMLLGIGGVCVAAGDAIALLSAWFRAKQESPVSRSYPADWRSGLLAPRPHRLPGGMARVGQLGENRCFGTLCVLLLAVGMSAVVQFSNPRAGCVNNGDFGRMMDQLGIIWQGDIFYNVEAQLGRRVIENYAFRGGFDWTTLTSLNPKYSLVYPAALVRLICGGQDFSTWYLSMVMNGVLVCCIVSMVYDLYDVLGGDALVLGMLLCGVFLCESYLVWFNSLFGESCMFMGLFMVLACCVHLAVKPANRCWPTVFLLLFSGRILVCAKAQMLVTLPFVLLLVIVFALYQRPLSVRGVVPYTLAVMVCSALICLDCVTVYRDNANISQRQTVWQSTFYGALMVTDDPEGAMEELGIDASMLPDIGKDAYQPDGDYVISPNAPEADAALYDHVNTFTMVKYYLRHPVQLLKMLNHAARVSRTMYNGFRVYAGQDYTQPHEEIHRLGLWQYWRSFFTFGSFFGYVLLYGIAACICIFGILRNPEGEMRWKMLAILYLGVMLIGAVQYPLSVIGNGFADNQKQMFGFTMCHDFLTMCNLTALLHCRKGSLLPIQSMAKRLIRRDRK